MSLDSRNEALNRKLEEPDVMTKSIDALVKGANRQRTISRWLALSIALDFLITIALTLVTAKTSELAHLAQTNQDAVVQNCETANESRSNQIKLWTYVFNAPTTVERTPQQEKVIADFKVFVNKTFAPRDCHAEINTPKNSSKR